MGDRDSEIAIVIEDNELFESRMNGQKYMPVRFAATFRRQLFKQHLGLVPPQDCPGPVTSAMRAVGSLNQYDFGTEEDRVVEVRSFFSRVLCYTHFSAIRIRSMMNSTRPGTRQLESMVKYTKSSSTVPQPTVSRAGMITLSGSPLERKSGTYTIKRTWNWVTSSSDCRRSGVTWLRCLQVSLLHLS